MAEQTLDAYVEVVPEPDGSTDLRIPPRQFWDCVECLSEHRLSATFTFDQSRFVARLPNLGTDHARDVLHGWHIGDRDHIDRVREDAAAPPTKRIRNAG